MADMKGAGMLSDVSLRGVNFRFWSGLWCSGQITVIFSGKGLFQGCSERNITKLYIFNLFYLLDSCNQSLKWSLLGVKKRLAHAQIGLLWGFNSKFPMSIPTPSGLLFGFLKLSQKQTFFSERQQRYIDDKLYVSYDLTDLVHSLRR